MLGSKSPFGIGLFSCISPCSFIAYVLMTERPCNLVLSCLSAGYLDWIRSTMWNPSETGAAIFLWCLTENWYIQLLVVSVGFLSIRLLVEIDFVSYTGWSNGDSFCFRSPPEDDSLWWLLLQLLYSWLRYTIWWTGMSSSEFPWAHVMKLCLSSDYCGLFADT